MSSITLSSINKYLVKRNRGSNFRFDELWRVDDGNSCWFSTILSVTERGLKSGGFVVVAFAEPRADIVHTKHNRRHNGLRTRYSNNTRCMKRQKRTLNYTCIHRSNNSCKLRKSSNCRNKNSSFLSMQKKEDARCAPLYLSASVFSLAYSQANIYYVNNEGDGKHCIEHMFARIVHIHTICKWVYMKSLCHTKLTFVVLCSNVYT